MRTRPAPRRTVPELVQLIEGLALRNPPPSAASIHRQIQPIAAQHGWPAPSYRTVHDIIAHLDPGLRTLAHEGPQAYRETFDLLYRREAGRANEIWQADHTRGMDTIRAKVIYTLAIVVSPTGENVAAVARYRARDTIQMVYKGCRGHRIRDLPLKDTH